MGALRPDHRSFHTRKRSEELTLDEIELRPEDTLVE